MNPDLLAIAKHEYLFDAEFHAMVDVLTWELQREIAELRRERDQLAQELDHANAR